MNDWRTLQGRTRNGLSRVYRDAQRAASVVMPSQYLVGGIPTEALEVSNMNRITDLVRVGTAGELLVQIRLLEHCVQAAPPLKDSGNDLIAVRGDQFRAIQVKTVASGETYRKAGLPDLYHVLAVVKLEGDEKSFLLDESEVFLIPHGRVRDAPSRLSELGEYRMTPELVDAVFSAKR